jgi:hypothetical protein
MMLHSDFRSSVRIEGWKLGPEGQTLISLSTAALTGLIFQVQTDDQVSGGKGKAKDPKSLSGGWSYP